MTDPEVRHIGVQTPLEAHMQDAAMSESAVLGRLEPALRFQRELQLGYQSAAEQLLELRQDCASSESRAEELQGALDAEACQLQLAIARSAECATANTAAGLVVEVVEGEVRELWASERHEANLFREAAVAELGCRTEMEASLAELTDSCVQYEVQKAHIGELVAEHERTLKAIRQEWHTTTIRLEEALNSHEEASTTSSQDSPATRAYNELQACQQELMRISEYSRQTEHTARQANVALLRTGTELVEAQNELARACAETQSEEALVVHARAEVAMLSADVVRECREMAKNEQALLLSFEAAETRERQERTACKRDYETWNREQLEFIEVVCQEKDCFEGLFEQEVRKRRSVEGCELEEAAVCIAVSSEYEHLAQEHAKLKQRISDLAASLHEASEQVEGFQANQETWSCEAYTLQGQLAASRGREAAMLQELERLRQVLVHSTWRAPGDVASDGELELYRSEAKLLRKSRAKALEVCRIPGASREQESRLCDPWKVRNTALVKEVAQLRERAEDLETQLRFAKQESERKRALILALQQRCAPNAQRDDHKRDILNECDESRKRLQLVQRGLARKDMAIQELRRELAEMRQQRHEFLQREEVCAVRAAADAVRARALRIESQRKEKALLEVSCQAEALKAQLAVEERERNTCLHRMRKLRTEHHGNGTERREFLRLPAKSAASIPASPRSPLHSAPLALADTLCYDYRSTVIDEATTDDCTPRPSPMSSIHNTAFEDSVQILNLRPEDLTAFLVQ